MRRVFAATALILALGAPVAAQDNIAAVIKACDQAAGSPFDKTLSPGVTGVGIDSIDPKTAVPACEAAAKAAPNDPRIQFELGRASYAAKDYERAVAQYAKADAMGYSLASNNLAVLYADGIGVEADQKRAEALFEKAAAAGIALAMRSLGMRYRDGKLVPQNYDLARDWLRKAAEAGDGEAMKTLGVFYEDGQGVPVDHVTARQWYERAALAGNAVGMAKLGYYYAAGLGGPKDVAKARLWYQKAIAAGNTDPIVASNLKKLTATGAMGPTSSDSIRTQPSNPSSSESFGTRTDRLHGNRSENTPRQ